MRDVQKETRSVLPECFNARFCLTSYQNHRAACPYGVAPNPVYVCSACSTLVQFHGRSLHRDRHHGSMFSRVQFTRSQATSVCLWRAPPLNNDGRRLRWPTRPNAAKTEKKEKEPRGRREEPFALHLSVTPHTTVGTYITYILYIYIYVRAYTYYLSDLSGNRARSFDFPASRLLYLFTIMPTKQYRDGQ